MKKNIISLVFILNVLIAFAASDQFVLKGNVEGLVSGNARLSYWLFGNSKWEQINDTSKIVQGHFQFKGNLKEPVSAQLRIGENDVTIYIEPTKMVLYVPKANYDQFRLKGSKTQDDANYFAQATKELRNLANRIHDQDVNNYKQLESTPETDPNYENLLKKRELISLQRDSVFKLKMKEELGLINSNLNSYYPVISHSIEVFVSRGYLSVDSARLIFNRLFEKVRLSTAGIQTNNYIKLKEAVVNEKIAPDFFTRDTIGKMIRLSDFREKSYVLLDFWASWCGPCIQGFPHIKNLYSKYHDKGLEVISISCDRSKEEWLSAIQKHELSFCPQVMSVQNLERYAQGYINKDDISENYPTDGIPKYILIDKTGKIIGKWEGYSVENEKNQDDLLAKILK